jgi:hypothetical protein
MMPFSQRLQFLLEKYDALILHGFGAFYARYQTAQWHPVTHRIIPPQKEISFNRSIDQTDGVLENEFKISFGLSSEESHTLVKGMVDFLLEELETHKRLSFEGVGELVVRPDGSWRFLPFEENHILAESFGLTSIQVRPVLRNSTPTTKPVFETETVHIQETNLSKFPWKAMAATFTLLAVTASLFWINPFSEISKQEHHTAQMVQIQPSSSFDSIKKSEEIKSDTLAETVEAEESKKVEVEIKQPEPGYYIIVSSTTSEKEAREMAKSHHWVALTFPEIGRFRLATNRFENRDEAQMTLKTVRAEINSQAWILKH